MGSERDASEYPCRNKGARIVNTAVIVNDIQFPFEDQPVLSHVVNFIRALSPDTVILNGDICDCYSISSFVKDPMLRADIALEVQRAHELMESLHHVPERVWIGGNHEARLQRYLWKQAPELAGIAGMTFQDLFRLGAHDFQWLPYGEAYHLGKLAVTHGDLVRTASGTTARAHFEKMGQSVLIGHTHRMGAYYKTQMGRPHVAYENGCLCNLKPEYVKNPDWQQGFSVVHYDPKSGEFVVQQVPIFRMHGEVVFYYGSERFARKEN